MIAEMLSKTADRVRAGQTAALVTVTKTQGSSPASVGQMMAVFEDGSFLGTVGGGMTEHLILEEVKTVFSNGTGSFSFHYDHAKAGMTCGGSMDGFVSILGSESKLYIFGGGHVAQSLAKIAAFTGFNTVIIEDRAELEEYFDKAEFILAKPDEYENLSLNSADYVVISTRGHKSDLEALEFALKRKPKYLGMIGSKNKVAVIKETLTKKGFQPQDFENVFTPIGLDIAAEKPSEIAVSILAEILLVKNGGSPMHLRDVKQGEKI